MKTIVDFKAFEFVPYPLVIVEKNTVIYLNRKANVLLKTPRVKQEGLNLKLKDFVLPQHISALKTGVNKIKGHAVAAREIQIRNRKGEIRDVEIKSTPISLAGKRATLITLHDISEQKKAIHQQVKSNEILNLIDKNTTDIIFKYDFHPKEHYAFVSNSAYNILGYEPVAWYKNKNLYEELMHPDDAKKFPQSKQAYINYISKHKKSLCRFIKKNKSIIWLETVHNIVKDSNGKVISIICLSRDVTKEKKTEASLHVTKEQLSLIANHAHDIIYFFTYQPEPKYLFISNSVEKLLGYKPSEFYKDPFFISKKTIGRKNEFKEFEKKSAKDQQQNIISLSKIKYLVKNANNEALWMEDHVNPVYDNNGKISFLFGIIRNINEIKEKEKELDQKWSDYKLLLDQSPIAFFIHSKGVCLMCNKAAVDLLKVKSEKAIIGSFIIDYIVPEQRKRAMERMRVATLGKELDFLSYQIVNSKNRRINVEIKTTPIFYNGADCVLSLVKDVSEREIFEKGKIRAELVEEHNKELVKEIELRKEVEKELTIQKNKLSSIFENSSHLVWTIDQKYRLTYFNSNFKIVFQNNYGVAPLLGKTASERIPKSKRKENENTWNTFYKKAFNGERVFFERKDNLSVQKGAEVYREVFMNPIYSVTGEINEISCMASDISENKRNQKRLIEQALRINTIFESGAQILWTIDKNKTYTSFNKNFAKMLFDLKSEDPKIGSSCLNLKYQKNTKEKIAFWNQKYDEVFMGKSLEFKEETKTSNEQNTVHQYYLHPIYNDSNEVIEVSVTGNNITKEIISQREIISQSAKLSAIFEGSSHYIWTVDKNNNLTSFNRNYTELIKKIYNTDPNIGESLNRGTMAQDDLYIKGLENYYDKAFSGEKINFELELPGRNNEKVFLDVFLNPVFDKNEIVEVSGIAHDVTITKLNEERIKQSLKEKEILLKEVHHRVKNNMQIISSILNLQSSYTNDKNILNLLRESQNRIKTMAYIHESLYQNKTFSSINFNEYLNQLIHNVIHSYSVSPGKINLEINCEKTILNLDTSIPLGLIINELVTNSIKHAFPAASNGNISINLRTQNKVVFLTVEDNGLGISSDISPENSGTLGLQLVYTLIDQINGKISFERVMPHGTRIIIRF